MFLLGTLLSASAQVPGYVPSSGLVGWWPFNGNANDASGNGNNGTVNGASLTTDRFGIVDNAYSFDGLNDFIQSDTISSLNSSINSISTWIYAPSFSMHHQIEYAAPTFGTLGRAFAFNTSRLAIVPTSNCVDASGPGVINLSGQLGTNSWYNLVFISDSSVGKFYINGVYIGQENIGSSVCQNPLTLILGRGTNGGGPMWYTGKIDDIGIWNRALTQSEVAALYLGCANSISTQPTNQTVNINSNTSFMIATKDSLATYQWQTDLGVGFQNLNNVGQYSGTTNNTLNVSNITMSNNNQPFRCIVSTGTCKDTSSTVKLTVNNNSGINITSTVNTLKVYPNPASTILHIDLEKPGYYTAKLSSVAGQAIISQTTGTGTIDISALANGVYILAIYDSNNKLISTNKVSIVK